MKIGPREQLIIAGVAIVVVVVALGALLVWPKYQELGALDGQISAAQVEVDSAKALLTTREASKNRAVETDARWLRLANLVPDGPDLPSLIVELQDAAFTSGVQLIAVTPSPPNATTTYYSIPVQLQVLGTWADTVDFLQRAAKLDRGIRIVESSSSRTDNTEQATRENQTIPDYAELTNIKLEAYMIPSSAPSSTTAPTSTVGH
jgi:Tfp pilus assembly protein PilO